MYAKVFVVVEYHVTSIASSPGKYFCNSLILFILVIFYCVYVASEESRSTLREKCKLWFKTSWEKQLIEAYVIQ